MVQNMVNKNIEMNKELFTYLWTFSFVVIPRHDRGIQLLLMGRKLRNGSLNM